MTVYAIKFIGGFSKGSYYAGYRKNPAKTLLGAQLFKSEKAAISTVSKSINFFEKLENIEAIPVTLEEA